MSNIAPRALIDEAKQADLLFRECWSGMRFHAREFGRACKWFQDKELHKYIPKSGSRVGFMTFDSYVAHVTGGECSRSKIYECIALHELTLGAIAIPPEAVDAMPKKNALKLSKVIRQLPEEKKTKKHLERITKQAQSETVNTFKLTAQKAINENLVPEKRKLPMTTVVLHLDPRAADKLNETIEEFTMLPGAVRDGDLELDLKSKAVLVMCTTAQIAAADEIKAAKAKAQREAPILSQAKHKTTEADSDQTDEEVIYEAPDAGTRVGIALDEGRAFMRKDETAH